MRRKILLLLFLSAILITSLTVGTLSNYTSATSFGTSIYPDVHKIKHR